MLIQEKAAQEVKLAIKPFYQNKDITKEEYKEIVRKAVDKVSWCGNPSRIPFTRGRVWDGFLNLIGTIGSYWEGEEQNQKHFLLSSSTRALSSSEQSSFTE